MTEMTEQMRKLNKIAMLESIFSNSETVQTIMEADEGIGLHRFNSNEEMWAYIDGLPDEEDK